MSRFVSAGAGDESNDQDEAWEKAQEQIEATRRNKADIGKQEGGKSLYETLQANKAAKQDAFEESIRLRNQFRSLDDDEVEFLDSVLESTRAKEDLVKKETAQELEAFRKQQEETERTARASASLDDSQLATNSSWTVSKKRKKDRDDLLGGVKLRKSSTGEKTAAEFKGQDTETGPAATVPQTNSVSSEKSGAKLDSNTASTESRKLVDEVDAAGKPDQKPASQASPPPVSLGLGVYSSDED